MNIAVTDRSGPDTSPMTLRDDHRPQWCRLPALGVQVCAIGTGGWRYIGQVISTDISAGAYTIQIAEARNALAERVAQLKRG